MTRRAIILLSTLMLIIVGTGVINLASEPSWKFGADAVGQCWTGLASSVDSTSAFGLHMVNCASPHSNETIAITKLPATVKKYPTRNSDALLTPAQELAIHNAVVKPILGSLDLGGIDATRLVAWEYPPTIAQWDRGARWLRIDFFLRNTGWPISFIEPVRTLNGKIRFLIAAAKKNPDLIGYCVDTASNDQLPTVNSGGRILADCTQHPRWHLVAVTNLVKGTNEPFPSASEVVARAKAACYAFLGIGIHGIAYTDQNGTDINRTNWNGSYTSSACWISKKP